MFLRVSDSLPEVFGIDPFAGLDLTCPPQAATVAIQLGQLAHRLMQAAKCHILPAPALAPDPPTLSDVLAGLRRAAEHFTARSGDVRVPFLWTDPAAFRSGAIGRTLAGAALPGHAVEGFLVLVAEAIEGCLIHVARQSPIRVAAPVVGDLQPGGPYLVLALCEPSGHGHVSLTCAHAVAVLDWRRFIPIASNLERDVLRALVYLQEALDLHGTECSILRDMPLRSGDPIRYRLTIRSPGMAPREITFALATADLPEACDGNDNRSEVVVSLRTWCDGTFMAWLVRALAD